MKTRTVNKYRPCWAKNYLPYQGILSSIVVGQESAVEQVAAILAAYKNRKPSSDFPGPRILLVGAPSCGKTYLAEQSVRLLDIPSVHINLASVSPPGYRGFDVGMGIKNLIQTSSQRRAEKSSALLLDEADKVIRRGNDEFMQQIEYSLLPILNGEKILVDDDGYGQVAKSFSTKNSIVFLMGVFPTINPKVWNDPELSKKALVKFGFTPELVSRLTHFIYLNPLKKGDLKKLIEREVENHSIIYQSEEYKPTLTPQELARAVDVAHSSEFGVRGMRVNINRLLQSKATQSWAQSIGAD